MARLIANALILFPADRRACPGPQGADVARAVQLTPHRDVYGFGTVVRTALERIRNGRYAQSRAMRKLSDLFGRTNAAPDVTTHTNETAVPAHVSPVGGSMRKRIAVMLAAIAVPAMAAPGDFGAMPGAAPTEAEVMSQRLAHQLSNSSALPFERPGMSFPGSAFYFLADPPHGALVAIPTTDASDPGADAGRILGEMIDAGPAARSFFSAGGASHARALECLAQAIWYEAASESEAGQRAVAQVVLNRVTHPAWPGSVCGVVYEGSRRATGCQFTFTCDGSLSRRAGGSTWAQARRIAGEALSGSVYAPIGHATHYHTLWVSPYWAASLDHVGTIGAHRFYRNRGAAGEKGAFSKRYSGYEPKATRAVIFEPTSGARAALSPDNGRFRANVTPENSAPSQPVGEPRIEPILADQTYAGVGQVREDYARAGQWKTDAAKAAYDSDEKSVAQPPRPGRMP